MLRVLRVWQLFHTLFKLQMYMYAGVSRAVVAFKISSNFNFNPVTVSSESRRCRNYMSLIKLHIPGLALHTLILSYPCRRNPLKAYV